VSEDRIGYGLGLKLSLLACGAFAVGSVHQFVRLC
jgi:hypothetical protein